MLHVQRMPSVETLENGARDLTLQRQEAPQSHHLWVYFSYGSAAWTTVLLVPSPLPGNDLEHLPWACSLPFPQFSVSLLFIPSPLTHSLSLSSSPKSLSLWLLIFIQVLYSIHLFIFLRNMYWAPTTCQNILDNGDSPENKAFSFMGSYNDKNNDKIEVMIIINSHWIFTSCQAMF